MTIYSDLNETTDYSSFSDPTEDLVSVTEGCCCAPDAGDLDDTVTGAWDSYYPEEPVFDDGYADAYSGYEIPVPVEASAVIPAGQPGGPELVASSAAAVMPLGQPGATQWQPVSDASDLYSSVATIGEPSGFSSYHATTLDSPFGAPIEHGTGFTPYGSESTSLAELVDGWGVGPAQATGPMFEPSVRYINAEPTGAMKLAAILSTQGDVFGQITNRETMERQDFLNSLWGL